MTRMHCELDHDLKVMEFIELHTDEGCTKKENNQVITWFTFFL